MTTPPPMPRWFLLLPLAAALLWWPIAPYWKSDDYLALHYASDLGRALHDFAGPQYGSTDIWWFYRPLITLSFWFDQCGGGPSPLISHASNVLAHATSALLVALLWRRFLPDARAFAAGLLWAAMPGHQAAILWAVGRVDSHTAVWCLLTLLLVLRRGERAANGARAAAWPMLLAFAAALGSKELAWVVPPIASVLLALRGDGDLAARLRTSARLTWPLYGLLGLYFALRFVALGRLVGGYGEMQFAPVAMASGLCQITADLLVPMRWSGSETLAAQLGVPRAALSWTAALPVLIAVAIALWQPRRLFALLMFVLACLPMAAFFASAHNVHNLRYYYLPSVALVGVLAASGRVLAGLVLATWLLPLALVRLEVIDADLQSRSIHAALQHAADGGASAPMFVAGLPHANASGHSLQFHFGVDRVLQPPFRDRGVALFALRPIAEWPGVFRLDPAGREPTALPQGSTWWYDGNGLQPARHASTLPDLPIAGDADGVLDLTSARLRRLERREERIVLTTHAGRPMAYRLTIFTACGYFCCLFADHGPVDSDHGTIDLRQFFVGFPDYPEPQTIQPAIYAPGEAFVMRGLEVPTTHDLATEFPVLLESGAIDASGFVAGNRARRLLTFRFDRGYTRWVHRALNLDH